MTSESHSMTLHDKVILITGASRGVGEAMAYGFAAEGAVVAAVARTIAANSGEWQGSLEETVDKIRELGGRALAIGCDVTDEAEVRAMVEQVESEAGPVDVLVNNAGLSIRGSIVEMSVEEFDRVMRVNVRGPFLTCKYVVPSMIERRKGNIINITSRQANWTDDSHIAYGASKAAVDRFTLNMAEDLKRYNIAVNAMSPGLITSYMTRHWDSVTNPRGLVIEPAEVVMPATLWLAQQDASYTGKVLLRNDFGKTWP